MADADVPATPEEEPAHDVLAAEAFAVPAADPGLRHHPVVLPEDPSGIAEPHDVLAAEEFAMPAPKRTPQPGGGAFKPSPRASRGVLVGAAAALLGLIRLRRRRG